MTPTVSRVGSKEDCHTRNVTPPKARFINPHRLFHGVWLPHWLEERPEISEKSKKLYAYLTYFAGGKGYAWPSFNHLAEKLHVSRRYVIKLMQELSRHRLITVTNVNRPSSVSPRTIRRQSQRPLGKKNSANRPPYLIGPHRRKSEQPLTRLAAPWGGKSKDENLRTRRPSAQHSAP